MGKSLMTKVANRIYELRKERGITQEELAFRSGLHKNYISDAERGTRNITIKALEKFAKGLEVDPSELFNSVDE
jgi:transcriptional regulator with XRE-family HTH domain